MDANIFEIDEALTEQAKKLQEVAKELSFVPIKEFLLNEETENICNKSYSQNGIYFFEMKNEKSQMIGDWAQEFKSIWRPDKNQIEHTFWSSGLKKVRIDFHKDSKEWIPFYIGKCRNVGKRVNEHLNQGGSKTTFGMKLKARKNLHGSVFKVSWIPLGVTNYDMIAPAIESALRNKYNPVLGRQ